MIIINESKCGCTTKTKTSLDGIPLEITEYACIEHYQNKVKNMKTPKGWKVISIAGISKVKEGIL